MTEIWKSIPGVDGYEASNFGNIRSLSRVVRSGRGTRRIKGRVLSPFIVSSTGYRQVKIRGRKYSAHRLVALVWCSGYFDGACVDHINGIRDDNRPENMEWVTPSENNRRSFQNGRITPTKGAFSSDHPTSKEVISTDMRTGISVVWPSAMDAVREGFDSSCISRCCNGLSKSHKGFKWRFAEYGDRHGVRWSEPNPYEVTA